MYQNEDNNSENVQSSSEEENGIYPLVNLNISLNNGQKTSLLIYENDNVEEKVHEFCLNNKISPNDQNLLLQRVKMELDTKTNTSKTDTIQYENRSTNKTIDEPKDNQQVFPKYNEYIPKEKNKLDHIFNESESFSASDSLKQSSNLNNLIRDFKSDSNNKINSEADKEFNFKLNNLGEGTSKASTLNNNIKKNINFNKNQNNVNNENQYIINNNNNILNNRNNNINNTNKNFPLNGKQQFIYQNNSSSNSVLNTNLNISPNKQINKFSNIYNKKNNQILYNNNSGAQINRLNNTFQNLGYQNNNLLAINNTFPNIQIIDYNTNQTQQNIIPNNDLMSQKIEDNVNKNIIYTSNTIIPYSINNKNNNKYNIKTYNKLSTANYNLIPGNNTYNINNYQKESIISNYIPDNISNQYNITTNQKGNIIYNNQSNLTSVQNNNFNKSEPLIYNTNNLNNINVNNVNDITYDNLNNQNINNINIINDSNSPKNTYININYDNLKNQYNSNYSVMTNQTAPTKINQILDYNNYENSYNLNNNTNYDTVNNPIIEYNNQEGINSPIIEYNINTLNNQIVEYNNNNSPLNSPIVENNNNQIGLSNQNSNYTIYENKSIQKYETQNNIESSNISSQNFEYSVQNNLDNFKVKNFEKVNNNLINNIIPNKIIKNNNSNLDINKDQNINYNITKPKEIEKAPLINNREEVEYSNINNNNLNTNLGNNQLIKNINTNLNSDFNNNSNSNYNLNNNIKNNKNTNINLNNEEIKPIDYNVNQKKLNNNETQYITNIKNNININNIKADNNIQKNIINENKDILPSNNINNNQSKYIKNENNISPLSPPPKDNLIKKKIEIENKIPKKYDSNSKINLNIPNKSVSPVISHTIKKNEIYIFNTNKIIDKNNIKEENLNNEIKSKENDYSKESISISPKDNKKENRNEYSDSNIDEKEPQDNVKKKDSDLPQDTDDINYKNYQKQIDSISNKNDNNSNYSNHNLSNLSNINISKNDISNSNISKNNISNSNISKNNINNSIISKNNISNSNISKNDIININISKNNLSDSNISKNDISNSNISKNDINNSNISKNNISNINNKNNKIKINIKKGNINKNNISKNKIIKDYISKDNIINNNNININSKINNKINNDKNIINKNNINKINKNNKKINYKKIIDDDEINESIDNSLHKNNDIKGLIEDLSQKSKKENDIRDYILNNNNEENNNFSYNESRNNEANSIESEKFINYLDKKLGINKPKYKNIINLDDNESPPQSIQYSPIKKENNNNLNKNKFNKKESFAEKKPMKILTFKNTEFNINNINKRNNSSGAKRNKCNNSNIKFGGERLYQQYQERLPKKMEIKKRILKERLEEESKEIQSKPRIDPNSEKIIEKIRNNEKKGYKVEDRLNNYGYNKRQKHLIEKANNDIRNQTKSPFKPKIDKKSRSIANKNKKNRIIETMNILDERKRRINYKKIDLEKEFGKRNRSIGNRNKNQNYYINFEEPRNSNNIINYIYNNKNKDKNQSKKVSNDINNENNFNFNSKNENITTSDENKTTMSQLNKTIELNKAYKDLYNSIDEKNDSDITKFFGNYVSDLNSKFEESLRNSKLRAKSKDNDLNVKKKNLFPDDKRSLTPQSYNTFDYLYYESDKQGEKNRKKQEIYFKRYFPFKPRISPYAQQLKLKNKESTKQFINRISKNLEEIKILNSNKIKNNRKNKHILSSQNSKNNFRPKITRGPKSPNQRNITVNLDGFYDKRITKEKTDLLRIKNEEEKEKKIIYNQKSKAIINKMKIQKYRELFNLLDSNKDGFISSSEIELTKIEENVLNNISPLLEELNQTKKKMDFKEFCIKIDKLMIQKKLEKNI